MTMTMRFHAQFDSAVVKINGAIGWGEEMAASHYEYYHYNYPEGDTNSTGVDLFSALMFRNKNAKRKLTIIKSYYVLF